MKRSLFIWFCFICIVAFATISFPQNDRETSVSSKTSDIEANYLTVLQSQNDGLNIWGAYFLRI